MLDPLTAISLAATVVQFVDFTGKLLSGAHHLYKSEKGATEANQELEDLARDLRQHVRKTDFNLITPGDKETLNEEDASFHRLSQQCDSVASELLETLNSLRRKDGNRAYNSVKQALLTILKQDDIDELQGRLDRIAAEVRSRMAERQQAEVAKELRDIAASNRKLDANRKRDIQALQSTVNDCFEQLNNRRQSEVDQAEIWRQLILAAQTGKTYVWEQYFLNTLSFSSMYNRFDSISKEHKNTFQWIFDDLQSQPSSQQTVNFKTWLTLDASLYWVTGKPGSGKSTLMKYIAENSNTERLLKQWADGDRLVFSSYYFWSAAKDPLQKSSTGLLRSILFQILSQCPDLIQYAFPSQWNVFSTNKSNSSLSVQPFTGTMSMPQLLDAFGKLVDRIPYQKTKFCLFIDGLDEYDGHPDDIVALVNSLVRSRGIKACVSSRPWNEFEKGFGKNNPWKLYIHELTRPDIQTYVEDLLAKDDLFKELQESDERSQDLITEIVDAAQGVFLWVFLVVRSLLSGLTNGDSIATLQKRLSEIPRSLEKYFENILFGVDDRYRQSTARTFTIALEVMGNPSLMTYWLMEELEMGPLLGMKLDPISKDKALFQVNQMQKRIKARCKGLLDNDLPSISNDGSISLETLLYGYRLDFLHRSVPDFLRTSDMQRMLQEWSTESFNPDLEICKAVIALMKITPSKHFPYSVAREDVQLLFQHAIHLDGECSHQTLYFQLMDQFILTLKEHKSDENFVRNLFTYPPRKKLELAPTIMAECVRLGLTKYVEYKLNEGKLSLGDNLSYLLVPCLNPDKDENNRNINKVDIEMLKFLLEFGLDPNYYWKEFMLCMWHPEDTRTIHSGQKSGISNEVTNSWGDAVKLLLAHGADPLAEAQLIYDEDDPRGEPYWIDEPVETILRKVLPTEQFSALEVPAWEERKAKQAASRQTASKPPPSSKKVGKSNRFKFSFEKLSIKRDIFKKKI